MATSFARPLMLFLLPAMACAAEDWIPLLDDPSLASWRASENAGTFRMVDGVLIVHGARSHLFYEGPVAGHNFRNFELVVEVLTKPGANSGIYFHTAYQETGWPDKGYEVQVNNTHSDVRKTGGLYAIQDNLTAPVSDDGWFELRIKVEGRRILTEVNGRVISEYTEPQNPERPDNYKGRLLSSGTIAIQGHDPDSEVHYRNLKVRLLP